MRGTTFTDTALLRSPRSMAVAGNVLVVGDDGTDSLLMLFDATTGRYTGSVGTRRTAGLRSFSAWFVEGGAGDAGTIYAFDPVLHSLLRVGVGRRAGEQHRLELDTAIGAVQLALLPKGRAVVTGLRIPGRFAILDSTGRVTAIRGPLPPGDTALDLAVRQHAFSARIAVDPKGQRVALVTRYADIVQVYDTSGALLATAPRPAGFDPRYDVGERGGAPALAMRPDSRIGYVAVRATADHIYALYSGRSIGGFGPRAYAGRVVQVYSWDGRLQRTLLLEKDADDIAVSLDEARLFVLPRSGHARVVAYDLRAPTAGARPS